MSYKLKNISEDNFNFEETSIPAFGVSGELSLDTYQRLLALYFNRPLVPASDENLPHVDGSDAEAVSPGETIEVTPDVIGDLTPEEQELSDKLDEAEEETEEVEEEPTTEAPADGQEPPKKRGRPKKTA